MNENKKNIEFNSGWILCPSKTFSGKFYYFNVLTGESAWSLNQADNKEFKNDTSVHKIADKSHKYPEPTTLPDDSPVTTNNISTNVDKLDLPHIPSTQPLPTFGQATFPKYVANVEPLNPNIIWTSVPFPMFCPESKKPMFDKVTQISEFERELFSQSSNIPLCKRFKNYEPPFLSFDRRNKIIKPLPKFEASTPKNLFSECVSESQNSLQKSLIKEPTLKFEPKLPNTKVPDAVKSNEKPAISFSNKVDSTKTSTDIPKVVQENTVLEKLDSTDLRFLLLAKRKSVDAATETAVQRKKTKTTELNPLPVKKNVSFNLKDKTDEDACISNSTTQEQFIPLTTNHTITTIDTPKPPAPLKDNKTRPPFVIDNKEDVSKESSYAKTGVPTFNNNTWYIVVDTDVLLLDYELIDRVVLSDSKCKLVIPRAVADDIEALCLGDCRGQQRVINARQLTRKLSAPPPHYIVEPQSFGNGNMVVTTESILECCMKAVTKNYYVVLITNDPHLQIRAASLNIPSFKLNEIQNGVEIRPKMSSEKSIKITSNDDVTDTKNQYNHSLNYLSSLKINSDIFLEDKNINFNVPRNEIAEKRQNRQNLNTLFNFKSPVKNLTLLSSDSETDCSSDCDKFKLIDITKPKCLRNYDYKGDSDGASDLSSEVTSLKLKDNNITKTQNVCRNPFLPQNGFVNFDKRILNPNTAFNTYTFGKTLPKEKPILKSNKDFLENNTEKLFCSIPIANMKKFQALSLEKSRKPDMQSTCSSLRQDTIGVNRENRILNPSQARIQKIISTTKACDDNQIIKTKDSSGLFKIPQLIPIKNGTRNTSVHLENSNANDKIGTRPTIDSIEENLKRFQIKTKIMMAKLKIRMDEWICSYMQILEDALVHILQESSVCMKNTVAPLTLKDTLNCIKMLYGNHTTIRNIINKLSELMDKCMVCVQGKLKMSLEPEDFMKIFGCGVLLILGLKIILPANEVIKEAEFRLNFLQKSIESNTKELDPDLVKSPSINRTGKDEEETRPQFTKKKSYIIDYLKKHFQEWASYTEDDDETNQIENHSNFKVLRTLGKNLNQLKIDKNKNLSLSNDMMANNSANKSEDETTKIITLIENNQVMKPDNFEYVDIIAKNQTGTNTLDTCKIGKNSENYLFSEFNEITEQEKNVPLKKFIKNIEEDKKNTSKVSEELNYTTHGNTFLGNSEQDGPKITRNVNLIDEFEKKIQEREPLDLDLLDYSEIYEPSVNENVELENNSEKNKISENQMDFLEDFYLSPSVSLDSKNNNYTFDSKNNVAIDSSNNMKIANNIGVNYFNSVNDDKNSNEKSFVESDTYTENMESYNDITFQNKKSEIHIDNSENHIDSSEIPHYDSGTHLENSEAQIESLKPAQIVQDDSTNDSGFENDSTNAHSLLKIFLNELSSSFKLIYSFVTKFIDEISDKELSEQRKDALHQQTSRSLEYLVAVIQQLRSIIKRESKDETVLKTLLRNAGVEATTDKRMTRYKQLVSKALEQALILESSLKIIVSTTIGDFEALSDNADPIDTSVRYFNIFE